MIFFPTPFQLENISLPSQWTISLLIYIFSYCWWFVFFFPLFNRHRSANMWTLGRKWRMKPEGDYDLQERASHQGKDAICTFRLFLWSHWKNSELCQAEVGHQGRTNTKPSDTGDRPICPHSPLLVLKLNLGVRTCGTQPCLSLNWPCHQGNSFPASESLPLFMAALDYIQWI